MSRVQIPPSIDRTQFTSATDCHITRGRKNPFGRRRSAAWRKSFWRATLRRDYPARMVLMPGDPLPVGGARQLDVNVQRFLPDPTGLVTLDADWTITAPDGQTVLAQGRFHVSLPGGTQPGAEAATMSAALGRLADTIASHISAQNTSA